MQNALKRCGAVAVNFSIYLKPVLYQRDDNTTTYFFVNAKDYDLHSCNTIILFMSNMPYYGHGYDYFGSMNFIFTDRIPPST